MKYAIALVIVVIGSTILITSMTEFDLHPTTTFIFMGVLVTWGIYFVTRGSSESEPEPEPEPETSSTGGRLTTLVVIYIILVVGIHFFELDNTNIGSIILIPGKIFIQILNEFIIPSIEWMFDEVD